MGLRGELKKYLKMRFLWAFSRDVATIALLALDRGESGERYLAVGRPDEAMSLADLCNRAAEMAGSPFRMQDEEPAAASGGYGSMSILAGREVAAEVANIDETTKALGFQPTAVAEGLLATVHWLGALGKI
jgi:nucleoside-diphosphate-sugar epimerase